MADDGDADGNRLPVLGLVCGGLIPVAAFYAIGRLFVRDWVLDLGSFHLPTPYHAYFLLFYAVFGTAALVGLTAGYTGLLSRHDRLDRLRKFVRGPSDRTWMVGVALLAILAPLVVRWLLLDGARLTDDESAYLFMSKVLLQGDLVAESHPAAVFFDRFAMVNDGTYYSQYFLGWPAVLAPFTALGLPGLANPVLAASSGIGVHLALRRLSGRSSARLGSLLFVGSPFVVAMGATLLSHLACLHWLVWAFWALLVVRDDDPPWWAHALLATCFSLAFFTRPTVAIGIGGAFLAAWAWQRPDLRAWMSFAVPAALFAALFLAVNALQNGSMFTTAYEVFFEYRRAHLAPALPSRTVPNFDFAHPGNGLALTAVAVLRLNFALWGWPTAFLFVVFAGVRGWRRIVWASIAGFLLVHFPLTDSGVDSFGPVHYFELTLPVLVLTVEGVRRAYRFASSVGEVEGAAEEWGIRRAAVPVAALGAACTAAALMYVPVRWKNLRLLAEQHNAPRRAVHEAEIDDAVIFADHVFIDCPRDPDGFVGWPPYNSPGYEDSIVWANHLTLERDRKFLARHYPNRAGYLLRWNGDCAIDLRRLDRLEAEDVSPGWLQRVRETSSAPE